jgi:hypothetical protein
MKFYLINGILIAIFILAGAGIGVWFSAWLFNVFNRSPYDQEFKTLYFFGTLVIGLFSYLANVSEGYFSIAPETYFFNILAQQKETIEILLTIAQIEDLNNLDPSFWNNNKIIIIHVIIIVGIGYLLFGSYLYGLPLFEDINS